MATLIVLAPVLPRGFVLVGDMVFVPFQSWKGAWLGLDGSPPRAVPSDAIVSALTHIVPGDLVQKAVLLAILLLAGIGTLWLLRDLPGIARFGGALLYVWNPYVFERLAIGHWALLVAYGALPWVVRAALRVRERKPQAQWVVLLWLAVAAAGSPTGGLLTAVTAVFLVGGRGARTWGPVVGSAVLVNLPWVVPGLLQSDATSDPTGVSAFAASADTPLGLWGSLAGLGGIWKEAVVPGERQTWVLATAAGLVTLTSLVALLRSARRHGDDAHGSVDGRLLALGVTALLLAALPGTEIGAPALEWLIEHLPGAGLLRDSQKLLMPFVLVVCIGFARVVAGIAQRIRGDGRVLVPALIALLPVALLPTMAWGLSGRLQPVTYPEEWYAVRHILEEAGAADDRILVLPWAVYRSFPWNEDRAVLDPAFRFFPGQVITSEDLVLDDLTVRGGAPLSSGIGHVLASGQPLHEALDHYDVRWLLVEKGGGGVIDVPLPEGDVRHAGPLLRLVDMGGRSPETGWSPADVAIVVIDGLVVAGLLLAAGVLARSRLHRRRR